MPFWYLLLSENDSIVLTEGFHSKEAIRDVEESEKNPQYWDEKHASQQAKKVAQAQRGGDKSTKKSAKKKICKSMASARTPATVPLTQTTAAAPKKQKPNKSTASKPTVTAAPPALIVKPKKAAAKVAAIAVAANHLVNTAQSTPLVQSTLQLVGHSNDKLAPPEESAPRSASPSIEEVLSKAEPTMHSANPSLEEVTVPQQVNQVVKLKDAAPPKKPSSNLQLKRQRVDPPPAEAAPVASGKRTRG